MRIWTDPEQVPTDLESVVTIGIFDGVHKGHMAIIKETIAQARALGVWAVILTFDPHPALVHHPETPLHLISSLDDRLSRLEALGVDAVLVQPYSLKYASVSAEDFVRTQLVGLLGAKAVVVGEDVRFGKDNAANGDDLRRFGTQYGFGVTLLADLCAGDGRRISSSWIRELLATGDVAQVAQILGRPHRVVGVVEHGFKRGRELGFPTANLAVEDSGEIPADGVYAGWLIHDGPELGSKVYLPAAISVGSNPYFGGVERTIEAHVLGRSDLNLYGKRVALDLIAYVRPMSTFDSLDELLARMDEDLRETAEILGVPLARRVDPRLVTAR